jgi:hypothetical protein
LPEKLQPLPVFKVLYRNTNRIQERGGRKDEVLHPVQPGPLPEVRIGGDALRDAVRRKDVAEAERTFAALAQLSDADALNHLLYAVQDQTEVHRVVLPYRAWDLLELVGHEQAHTLLRQSVRYCVKAESWQHNATYDEPRTLLPKLLEQHKLLDRTPGTRTADDQWVDELSQTFFKSTAPQAAEAAAAALAEGFAPAAIGEASSATTAARPPRSPRASRRAASTATASGFTPATARTRGATSPASAMRGTPSPASSSARIKSRSTAPTAAVISRTGSRSPSNAMFRKPKPPTSARCCAKPTTPSARIFRAASPASSRNTARWATTRAACST